MGSLERCINEKYDIKNENDIKKIYSILDSVNSEEKVYAYFGCRYSRTNKKYLCKISEIVGFDILVYKERRSPKVKYCINCGKKLNNKNQKKFCCRSCAVKYNNHLRGKMPDAVRMKIRMALLNRPTNNKKTRVCIVCGCKFYYTKGINTRKICSAQCREEYDKHRTAYMSCESLKKISENGRKVIQQQGDIRRSKNEILFCNLCEGYFNNVKHNVLMFNGWDADVILPDYKLAILWNGAWHYKQISKTISLKQIQNRDKIKINEIKKTNYVPYIIKDMGRYNEKKVFEEFEKLKIYIKEHCGVV